MTKQTIANIIEQSYNNVFIFNDVANNLTDVTLSSIASQLDFIQEEYLETVQAYDDANTVELLDGACDLLVTVFGLLQKLEATGFDVAEAIQRVDANNLSKYIPAGKTVRYSNEFHTEFNEKYQVSVVKDKNGKIRKHGEFKEVDLTGLTPIDFFQNNNKGD
jgi:phosphoribosyl-ATP pyrophosphohydrolase